MSPKSNRASDDLQHLLPLTPAVFFVLFALAEGEKHGYAIMQVVSTLSENKVRMGPGTLYTTIQRLLNLSLIEEVAGPSDATDREGRRRYYRLTGNGKTLLEAEVDRMESVVRRARRKTATLRTSE
jgi:DNA-binding PadR family transcriptional regulator